MKLMYVIPGLGSGGGAERSLAAMVPFWTDRMDVHIVTFSDRDALADELTRAGARVTNLGPRGRVALARELASLGRRTRPDLIHTTLFDADLAGRLAAVRNRIPVSSSLVGINYGPEHRHAPGGNALRLRAAQFADAASSQVVARFHALTSHVAKVMGRRLLVRPSRIDVIPRGRDGSLLDVRTPTRRAAVRRSLGITSEPLILSAARHEWPKGLDVLLRAAPQVLRHFPDAQFVVGGRDGSQTSLLHALVDQLGLTEHVRFLGPRNDVPDLMAAADAFCVPSRWEGFGSILVEAMAAGVPTVATDIPSLREVAGPDPWMRLASVNDPVALARALVACLLDRNGSERLVDLGQARFRTCYRAEHVAGRMLDFFARASRAKQLPSRDAVRAEPEVNSFHGGPTRGFHRPPRPLKDPPGPTGGPPVIERTEQ